MRGDGYKEFIVGTKLESYELFQEGNSVVRYLMLFFFTRVTQ